MVQCCNDDGWLAAAAPDVCSKRLGGEAQGSNSCNDSGSDGDAIDDGAAACCNGLAQICDSGNN